MEYGTLVSEAESVPPGSLGVHFQPHLRLGNPPHNDPASRAAFIGLTADVTRGTLFRAVLEGLAYESRLCLDAIVSQPGICRPDRIVAIGGNTRNRLLMQIKSSVFNQRISMPRWRNPLPWGQRFWEASAPAFIQTSTPH